MPSRWVQAFSTQFCEEHPIVVLTHFYHLVIFLGLSFLSRFSFVFLFKLKCPFVWKYVNYVVLSFRIVCSSLTVDTECNFSVMAMLIHFIKISLLITFIIVIIIVISSKRVIHYIRFNHRSTDYVRSYYVCSQKAMKPAVYTAQSAKLIATIPIFFELEFCTAVQYSILLITHTTVTMCTQIFKEWCFKFAIKTIRAMKL